MPKQGKSTGDAHHRHPGPLKKRGRGKPMAAAAAPMTGNNGSDGNDGQKDVAITTTVKQKVPNRPLVPSASSVLLELADKHPPTTATASASAPAPAAASATNKMSHPPNVGGAPAPTDGTDDPHHSVVPRLMDIYDDLAQSSTPQVGSASLQHHAYYATDPATDAHGGGGRRGTSARPRRASAKRSRTSEEYHRSASGSSGGNGGRKKGKASSADQRWSKRFTWPDELHRDFVSAIFDVGLKHSSPSAIIEFMQPNPDVTSERVKSHLQKYRLNRKKSRGEFMGSYDAALAGYRKRRDDGEEDHEDDVGGLSCGEAAALCTHASLAESGRPHDPPSMMEVPRLPSPVPPVSSASQVSTDESGGMGSLPLPLLTASEKDGPVGQAFGYLVGMHHALSRQLEEERRRSGGGEAGASQHHPQQHHEPQPRREGRHEAPAGYSPPQQPSYHPRHQPPAAIVEQAARAASMQDGGVDPSMMEVAASIPHATFVPVPRQTYAPQYAPAPQPRAYQNQYEHQPQEQQYQQAPAPAPTYQNQQYQQAYHPPQEVSMPPPQQRQGQGSYPTAQQHQQHAPAAAPAPAMRRPAPPQSRHQQQPSHHPSPPSAPAPTANPLAPTAPGPSPASAAGTTGRNTLRAQEESAAMQQEMRGQLAFQTKMRQLKRIELSKYGASSLAGTTGDGDGEGRAGGAEAPEEGNGDCGEERPGEGGREGGDGGPQPQQGQQQAPEHAQQQQQGQGQGGDGHEHGDILWNPGEDDQMLFDFLMEP